MCAVKVMGGLLWTRASAVIALCLGELVVRLLLLGLGLLDSGNGTDWARYELARGDQATGEAMWQEARAIFERLNLPLLVAEMEAV